MKYLFFDIECSNGHNICSFGYVIADQSFCILQKEDIVINPESPILLAPHGKRPKIQLAYSDDYLKHQPTFDAFYPKIKGLLCDKNTILFGHSISSDFGFLNLACKRYNLPGLEIEGYDMQKAYQMVSNCQHVQSLESIIEELQISHELVFHKSCDDAEATMLICQKIFEKYQLNMQNFKKKFANCLRKNSTSTSKELKSNFTQKVNELRKKHLKAARPQKVAFSDGFKTLSPKTQFKHITNLFKAGFDYTNRIKDCDIFVVDDKAGNRKKYFDSLRAQGLQKSSITKNQLAKLLSERIDATGAYNKTRQQ